MGDVRLTVENSLRSVDRGTQIIERCKSDCKEFQETRATHKEISDVILTTKQVVRH